MAKSNPYKVLSEKYETVLNTENEVREIPFTVDELKVLSALYDFQVPQNANAPTVLKRIVKPGIVQHLSKFSDDSFVCIEDNARGKIKTEYSGFYDACQKLEQPYKSDAKLDAYQTPMGKDEPYGLSYGGQHGN